MATINDHRINVHGATLTRRQFVKTGGALVVGLQPGRQERVGRAARREAAAAKNSLDADALPARGSRSTPTTRS